MTDQELQKQQQELQKQRDHEADLQRLRGFRPIDDTFMRCIYQDNIPLAEMTLRIITGINDLVLTKGETQKISRDFLVRDLSAWITTVWTRKAGNMTSKFRRLTQVHGRKEQDIIRLPWTLRR